jgi:hypothetical protein
MKPRSSLSSLDLLIPVVLFLTPVRSSQADTIIWTNTSGGVWTVANNWSPNQVPGPGDAAVIRASGAYTVVLDTNPPDVGDLILGAESGRQALDLSGHTLVANGSLSLSRSGQLNFAAGTLTVHESVTVKSGATVDLLPGGALTVDGSLTVEGGANFNLAGGALSVGETLDIAGNLDFTAGGLSGTPSLMGALRWLGGQFLDCELTVTSAGRLDLDGPQDKTLRQTTLHNNGTVSWAGTGRLVGYFDRFKQTNWIENNSGAVFQVQNDTIIVLERDWGGLTGLQFVFDNSGTLVKQAGHGTTTFNADLTLINSGLVEVRSGTLRLGGGSSTGTFQTAANALTLFPTNYTLGEGTRFTGEGIARLAGGTITLAGTVCAEQPAPLARPTLELAGAGLSGAGTLQGGLKWLSQGLTNCDLSVATNGVLNIEGAADKTLYRSTLSNEGTVIWSGTGRLVGYFDWINQTNLIANLAGGQFHIQNDAGIALERAWSGLTGLRFVINNEGTVRKSAGTGTTTFDSDLTFNNEGTGLLDVQSGTLRLGRGRSTGAFDTAAGAVTVFSTNHVLADGTRFGGCGAARLAGGTITLSGAIDAQSLELAGAILAGEGTLSGRMDWITGSLANCSLTIAPDGRLCLPGPADKTLRRTRLNNAGTVNWTGTGRLVGYFDGENQTNLIANLAGGVFNIQNDTRIAVERTWSGLTGLQFVFDNAGLVLKSDSTKTTIFESGVVFTNKGMTEIGSGILRIAGKYAPTASSTFSVGIGGPVPGTEHGQLQVDGRAVLAGAIAARLTGTKVKTYDVFTVLQATNLSGHFVNDEVVLVGGRRRFVPLYGLTAVQLRAECAPTATPDNVTRRKDASVTFNVLTNDTTECGDPFELVGFEATAYGVVTDLGGGSFQYAPDTNHCGADAFTYTITDTSGRSAIGLVTLAQPLDLRVLEVARDRFVLGVTGEVGCTYAIQACADLSRSCWSTLLVTNLTETPITFTDSLSPATARQRFYRALVEP